MIRVPSSVLCLLNLDERDHGIQEIQNQIGEVNEIFKDLDVLFHEQGVLIDDIGSHVRVLMLQLHKEKHNLLEQQRHKDTKIKLIFDLPYFGDIQDRPYDSDRCTRSMIERV